MRGPGSLLLALAGALALLLGAASPAAAARLAVGINADTQGWGPGTGAQQDLARSTGARWLREDFGWDVFEPRDDRWDWERFDRVVGEAARRHLDVLPLVHGTPRWTGLESTEIPSDPSEYAEAVAALVRRYGPRGDFWRANPGLPRRPVTYVEIWNEPYIGLFSNFDVDPRRYARLFRAAVQAGRRADPGVKYLIEAEQSATNRFERYVPWIGPMFQAVPDLAEYVDGIAIHPYSALSPDATSSHGHTRWVVPRLEGIHREFRRRGVSGRRLWITEIGWPTCRAHRDCVRERDQARHLKRTFQLVRGRWRRKVAALFVYHLRDRRGARSSEKEGFFGLLRRDGSRKPAFRTVRREMRRR